MYGESKLLQTCGDFFENWFKTRIDVYETLCPQQMLVHKGGKIKNWGGVCRDVTPTKLQSQNILKEHWGGGGGAGVDLGGGGQDGCERSIKVFFLGGGVDSGGSGWEVRVDVNREVKFL